MRRYDSKKKNTKELKEANRIYQNQIAEEAKGERKRKAEERKKEKEAKAQRLAESRRCNRTKISRYTKQGLSNNLTRCRQKNSTG
jgi:hypothetical protein